MKNISELAYELYKIDWEKSHMITPEVKQDAMKDYFQGLVDFDGSYSFDDYIYEFGYSGGEIYACYDEFMNCEYLDEEYVKYLLNNDSLFKEYEYDLQEHISIETEISGMYSKLDKINVDLQAEYVDGETDWAAQLEADYEKTETLIFALEEAKALRAFKKPFENAAQGINNKNKYDSGPWSLGFNSLKDRDFTLYYHDLGIVRGNMADKKLYILNGDSQEEEFMQATIPMIERILPEHHFDIGIEILNPFDYKGDRTCSVLNADFVNTINIYVPEYADRASDDDFGYAIELYKIDKLEDVKNVVISMETDTEDIKYYSIGDYNLSCDKITNHLVVTPSSYSPMKEAPVIETENNITEKESETSMDIEAILKNEPQFKYMLLDRLRMDCEYYLGNEGKTRHPKHLWAGNEKDQITVMKAIYNSFPDDEKPEWLSEEKILDYEKQMVGSGIKNLVNSSLEEIIKNAEAKVTAKDNLSRETDIER